MNTSWTFSYPGSTGLVIVQVIWAIVWSMIILAVLVRLSKSVILIFGLVIVAGHNLLGAVQPQQWGQWVFFGKFCMWVFSEYP